MPAHQSRQYRFSADRVRDVIKAAKDHGCSMRIGVNAGSAWKRHLLEKYGEPCPEAMVESRAGTMRKHSRRTTISSSSRSACKASDVFLAVAAYNAAGGGACDYPLHVGVTEAGGRSAQGTIKSLDRAWVRCCGPASATRSASRCRRSPSRGGEGRLRHPEVARTCAIAA